MYLKWYSNPSHRKAKRELVKPDATAVVVLAISNDREALTKERLSKRTKRGKGVIEGGLFHHSYWQWQVNAQWTPSTTSTFPTLLRQSPLLDSDEANSDTAIA